MTTNTSPDNLLKPQSTDAIAPLATMLGNMMDSVQTALTNRDKSMYLRFATKAAMDATPGTSVGQHAYVYGDSTTAYNREYRWNGSAWGMPIGVPFATAAGTGTWPTVGSGASTGNITVTFPTGRFTVAPIVVVSPDNSRLTGAAGLITTTNFGANFGNYSGLTAGTGSFSWYAVQMTPTTAAG